MTPRRIAASAGSIAAAPMIATITKSDGSDAASITACAAGGGFDPGPGKTRLQFGGQFFITDHRAPGLQGLRLFDQQLDIVLGRHRGDRKCVFAIHFAGMGDHIAGY